VKGCPAHRMRVVFVTHTGWEVTQCSTCGEGDIVLPKGRMCECSECDGKKRPEEKVKHVS
jgi:hypothetical protein